MELYIIYYHHYGLSSNKKKTKEIKNKCENKINLPETFWNSFLQFSTLFLRFAWFYLKIFVAFSYVRSGYGMNLLYYAHNTLLFWLMVSYVFLNKKHLKKKFLFCCALLHKIVTCTHYKISLVINVHSQRCYYVAVDYARLLNQI